MTSIGVVIVWRLHVGLDGDGDDHNAGPLFGGVDPKAGQRVYAVADEASDYLYVALGIFKSHRDVRIIIHAKQDGVTGGVGKCGYRLEPALRSCRLDGNLILNVGSFGYQL